MLDYTLKNIDPECIEDLLVKVEKSFDIKFVGDELIHITTFGELCDHIVNKIKLDRSDDCTSQQAFYKLRGAISSTLQIDNQLISTTSLLADILPQQNRHTSIKQLESLLGFRLNILSPPFWVICVLLLLSLASFINLFFYWKMGIAGITFSIAGFWLADSMANELDLQTVGQVAEKMARENYLQSRRNPKTFNQKEVEKVLTDWFADEFGLEKEELTREAKL
ncbi:hypothetical protein DPV69_17785 [Pedobacter chitinilyticus]|uniref:Uncharacterized protein n=1 Tax=Pedobacter chitinilyticus TaxID=2233776 RepID=A0A443YMK2_9SPHI|nr:hypothetical protein DPV69_17785 [Pedobacter chitinilyticus]